MMCGVLADISSSQVVSEWMRPTDIVKEKHMDSHPCLFSGVASSSDVCQVLILLFHTVYSKYPLLPPLFFFFFGRQISSRLLVLFL